MQHPYYQVVNKYDMVALVEATGDISKSHPIHYTHQVINNNATSIKLIISKTRTQNGITILHSTNNMLFVHCHQMNIGLGIIYIPWHNSRSIYGQQRITIGLSIFKEITLVLQQYASIHFIIVGDFNIDGKCLHHSTTMKNEMQAFLLRHNLINYVQRSNISNTFNKMFAGVQRQSSIDYMLVEKKIAQIANIHVITVPQYQFNSGHIPMVMEITTLQTTENTKMNAILFIFQNSKDCIINV